MCYGGKGGKGGDRCRDGEKNRKWEMKEVGGGRGHRIGATVASGRVTINVGIREEKDVGLRDVCARDEYCKMNE